MTRRELDRDRGSPWAPSTAWSVRANPPATTAPGGDFEAAGNELELWLVDDLQPIGRLAGLFGDRSAHLGDETSGSFTDS